MKNICYKFVFLPVICLLLVNLTVYGQGKSANDCKYTEDKIDEFTKERIVKTETKELYNERNWGDPDAVTESLLGIAGSLLSSVAKSSRVVMVVQARFYNGRNCLLFDFSSYNTGTTASKDFVDPQSPFYEIDLLLENGEVASMKGQNKFLTTKDNFNHLWQLYAIDEDSEWIQLKTFPLKKMRMLLNDGQQRTIEVKEEYANNIMNLINCIDVLQIPKPSKKTSENMTKKDLDQSNNAEQKTSSIKIISDTITISIYKQWKLVASVGEDGNPEKLQYTKIIQFFKNGTYKSVITLSNGSQTKDEGKFELLVGDKIIVFMSNINGISSNITAEISKLTNKALELKGKIHSFYVVD